MPLPDTTVGWHRPRILLVDDDAAATRKLGKLLKGLGYDVGEQSDSTKAQAFARRFQPDLMILDIFMPWITGTELADIFSSDDALCDVPVIFMTGYDTLGQGISTSYRVLSKPFLVEDLCACVEESLAGKSDVVSATPC